jgi:hypothetical protein
MKNIIGGIVEVQGGKECVLRLAVADGGRSPARTNGWRSSGPRSMNGRGK